MSSTGCDDVLSKGNPDPPPSYNTISPYAPPTSQPTSVTSPEVISTTMKGVPPGLEYLIQTNQLVVQEKFTTSQGWGRNFHILNGEGQKIFEASHNVGCCRPMFEMNIRGNDGRNVMEMSQNCSCSCTEQTVFVTAPPQWNIGFVSWHWNAFTTHLSVKTAAQVVVLKILGPSLQTSIFGTVNFEIKSVDEQHVVGIIRYENDTSMVSFPVDLEVTTKALLLAACFYLNSSIYQKRIQMLHRQRNN